MVSAGYSSLLCDQLVSYLFTRITHTTKHTQSTIYVTYITFKHIFANVQINQYQSKYFLGMSRMSTAFRISCVYLYGNICRIKYNYTTVLDKWKMQTFVLSVAHVICQSLLICCLCIKNAFP